MNAFYVDFLCLSFYVDTLVIRKKCRAKVVIVWRGYRVMIKRMNNSRAFPSEQFFESHFCACRNTQSIVVRTTICLLGIGRKWRLKAKRSTSFASTPVYPCGWQYPRIIIKDRLASANIICSTPWLVVFMFKRIFVKFLYDTSLQKTNEWASKGMTPCSF